MTILTQPNQRFGLHYFPDTIHYRQTDLLAWLPELKTLGIAWLTLNAPADRAIPEDFIRGLIDAGIEPILHFAIPMDPMPALQDIRPLIEAYSRWGIRYITLFDRPNSRQSWPATTWAQTDLVERFLDRFIPFAELLIEFNLNPVFSPLEPGGDYWDTAFLRGTLQSLQRRGKTVLIDKLIVGAYAASGIRPLDWGAGGPERWPGSRPYYTPAQDQDQRGFCIFDWYRTIVKAVLGKSLPMILFGVGSPGLFVDNGLGLKAQPPLDNVQRNVALLQYIADIPQTMFLDGMAPDILACNFWLLSASEGDSQVPQAWYLPSGQASPIVGVIRQLRSGTSIAPDSLPTKSQKFSKEEISSSPLPEISLGKEQSSSMQNYVSEIQNHPIARYLLLPVNENGSIDLSIEKIYPFVKKHNMTIGFSIEEAALASQVTVLENEHKVPLLLLEQLRASGSKVVVLSGSGMELASFLSEL